MPRSARLFVGIVILGILAIPAGYTLSYLSRAVTADGPNTIGEAGKLYFASRIQEGRGAFDDGHTPPYYPSFHGALTHGLVAVLGDGLHASGERLYLIGRSISVILTLGALLLLGNLCFRFRIRAPLVVGGLFVWLASFDLIQHSISYRPDNWLFFLGTLGCWILTSRPDDLKSLFTLALLPAVAFHVKAPGVVLGGAIVGTLLLRGQWRRAMGLGVVQCGVLLVSIQMLEVMSGGRYLGGLQSAADVEYDALNVIYSLIAPGDLVLLMILFVPLIWVSRIFRDGLEGVRRFAGLPLLVFWAVTIVGYGWASYRSGSNTYYFLEPASYGLLLGLLWLEDGYSAIPDPSRWAPPPRIFTVVSVVALLAVAKVVVLARNGHPVDVALYRTEQLSPVRQPMADQINESDLYCYSNDPGLNVLLERPAVIYPLLQMQMIDAGTLTLETLIDPVGEAEFDCVALAGPVLSYRGRPVLPDTFLSAVRNNYSLSRSIGEYEVRFENGDVAAGFEGIASSTPFQESIGSVEQRTTRQDTARHPP